MGGEGAEMLAIDTVTGKLAQAELMGVIADLSEAESASNGFKVGVIGMRQRLRKTHVRASAQRDRFFAGDDFFIQARQSHSYLDGGAGLRAFTERQLLVDHGKNASAGGINGDDGSIHVAQSINGSLAHDGIFAFNDVAVGDVVGKGAGGEALNPAMAGVTTAQADGL